MHFVRIDNRLVHGQVIETWLPHTRAQMIVVVNDELAGNMLRQEIMSLAIPDGVEIVFLPVGKVTAFLTGSARQDMDALILFSSCADARAASVVAQQSPLRPAISIYPVYSLTWDGMYPI